MYKAQVIVPFVDLLREKKTLKSDWSHQSHRETQLLFGETVTVLEEQQTFVYVHCHFQPKGIEGYPGWVLKSALSKEILPSTHVVCIPQLRLDTYLLSYGSLIQCKNNQVILPNNKKLKAPQGSMRPLEQKFHISQLVFESRFFLDKPYLWGGCGFCPENKIHSVDCSSLVHLLCRAQGLFIPRDAQDQAQALISPQSLQPGDLLYLEPIDKPKKISHVILYLGNATFIHASETAGKVELLVWGKDIWEKEGLQIYSRLDKYHTHIRRLDPLQTFLNDTAEESTLLCESVKP